MNAQKNHYREAAHRLCPMPGDSQEPPRKFESTTQPGLSYWAEKVSDTTPQAWHVIAQAAGHTPTEAFDDWFANERDAQETAAALACGRA